MSVALASGETFAGYRIEAVVGRGGMGVVYRATDLRLERPVALKLVAPELAENELFRRRFLKEPKLAAALDHPHVVPIYEAGEHEGRLYLAMRFVDGSDMRTLLRQDGGLPLERALAILAQVASALDAAHRRGLVHRDVKPANVLVDEDGHAYLTDFGVTKQLGGDSTDTGQLVGTLDYLAPEQIRGEAIDGRADQYALACVLYECVAGAPPFHRDTEAETLWAHMQERVPSVPGRPELDPVLRKALAKEPGDRYGSCAELIEAARLALAGVRVPLPASCAGAGRWSPPGWSRSPPPPSRSSSRAAATTARRRSPRPPAGNGVAAIDGAGARLASFTGTDTPPSNVAVGEGGVWVLSLENRTVSRIDPETTRWSRTPQHAQRPDRHRGRCRGGLVGNSPSDDGRLADRPADGGDHQDRQAARQGTRRDLPFSIWGFPQIAVGAGAVWAINPDRTVSRIDPATGRRDGDDRRRRRHDRRRRGGGVARPRRRHVRGHPDRPATNRVGRSIRVGARACPRSRSVAAMSGRRRRGTVWCGGSSRHAARSRGRSTSASASRSSPSTRGRSGRRTTTTAPSRAST